MAGITRFSIVYDPREDRMALDGVDDDGATTRLWLTRRLCKGVAAHLIPQLQRVAEEAGQGDPSVQSWAQAAALQDLGKVPAVQAGDAAVVGLAHTVNIQPRTGGVVLTIAFDDQSRTIDATYPALRQTLFVLHRLHLAAGWGVEDWPDWIADPAARAATTGSLN
ncbi:MAG: hypothetical protein ACOY4K_16660 [Pseudomonadota bacterium]